MSMMTRAYAALRILRGTPAVARAAEYAGAVWTTLSSIGGTWWGNAGWDHDTDPGTWQKGLNRDSLAVMANSAVYSCTSIISGDIAKLGSTVYRRMPDGGFEEAPQQPLHKLLRRPNHYQTSVDFWQFWLISTLLAGNTYVKVDYDRALRPNAWHILDPRYVEPLISDDGDVFYRCNKNKLGGVAGDGTIYTQRDIIHHRMMTLCHPLIGVTPLYASAASAMMGVAAQRHARKFFENQSRPSGVLTAPGRIDKDTATRLKADWEENTRAGNAGRMMVLGSGLEWQPLTMTATDSQLLELLRYSSEDVARCYRVPTFMLGDLTKVTYKNSEQLMRVYYSGCLQYHLEAIEERLDNWFDLPEDVYVEFDLDTLLRTEMDVRFASWATALQAGFMTINQVRRYERWAKVKGGDEPLVQVQYKPLSQVIAPPPPPPTPAPEPDATGNPADQGGGSPDEPAVGDDPPPDGGGGDGGGDNPAPAPAPAEEAAPMGARDLDEAAREFTKRLFEGIADVGRVDVAGEGAAPHSGAETAISEGATT